MNSKSWRVHKSLSQWVMIQRDITCLYRLGFSMLSSKTRPMKMEVRLYNRNDCKYEILIIKEIWKKKHPKRFYTFFYLGLTALEVWCLAMIGLVFLAFLAYIVILAWLRTRLIHVRVRYVVIMTVTTKIIIIIILAYIVILAWLRTRSTIISNAVTHTTHIKDC